MHRTFAPTTLLGPLVSSLLLLLSACGGSAVGRASGGPLIDSSDEATGARRRRTREPPSEAHRVSGQPYAAGPMLDFANGLTDLALAALANEHTNAAPVPIRAGGEGDTLRWERRGPEPVVEPRPIGVALEVEIVLKRGERREATGAEAWGSLRIVLVTSRHGVRLIELRPRMMEGPRNVPPIPAILDGLPSMIDDVLTSLRAAELGDLRPTEADRALVANETLWAELAAELPTSGRLRQIADWLHALPDAPVEIVLGYASVVLRDPEGSFFDMTARLEPEASGYVLRPAPLFRVRRLWPLP